MNGYYSDALEDLNEVFEDYEYDESDESDEAAKKSTRFRAPRTPTGRNLFRPKPKQDYVTTTMLQSALDRVGAQIKANGDAVKQVNTRLNTVGTKLDEEAAARKKDAVALRGDVKRMREMSLLPMLMQKAPTVETKTETVTFAVPGIGGGPATNVQKDFVTSVAVKQSTDILLPMVLMMGMGDSGKGDDNNMMLMLAVMMSQQNK